LDGRPKVSHFSGEEELHQAVLPYQNPSIMRSIWQLLNSFIPFIALLYLMYLSLAGTYWITLGLAILAAGFLVRIFIIQHDCGHGSFFRQRKINDRVGYFCSMFTLVPYFYWRRQHALHHSTNGNLDRRGYGDIHIQTVREYLALSRWQRLCYRAYRHPLMFLVFGPAALLFYVNRVCPERAQYSKRDLRNLRNTNLIILAGVLACGAWIGFLNLFMIAGPVIFIAMAAGIWLFYIQHQFEHAYWKPNSEWNYTRAAMQGSSFYRLPRVIRWFTGNIGYHHIHHLQPAIPNYELARCYRHTPEFHDVYEITLLSSLKTMFLSVWDEQQQRLISFREIKRRYRNAVMDAA